MAKYYVPIGCGGQQCRYQPYFGPILTAEESQWDKIFEVNAMGYFFLVKAVQPVVDLSYPSISSFPG